MDQAAALCGACPRGHTRLSIVSLRSKPRLPPRSSRYETMICFQNSIARPRAKGRRDVTLLRPACAHRRGHLIVSCRSEYRYDFGEGQLTSPVDLVAIEV